MPNRDVVVVGYARVSATSALHAVTESLSIALRIDRRTHLVTAVDSTAVTALVREWIADVLEDADFAADISPVLDQIEEDYLGHAAGSIRQAVNDAWRRYEAHRLLRTDPNPGRDTESGACEEAPDGL